jgi:hypothetical protein
MLTENHQQAHTEEKDCEKVWRNFQEILLQAWMSLMSAVFVKSPCDGPLSNPEESYWLQQYPSTPTVSR